MNEVPIDDSEQSYKFDGLFDEIKKELYLGCQSFSALNFVVKLMHLKVLNKWSNKSSDMLLKLLKEAFSEETNLSRSHYEMKTKLHNLELEYESIHVCKYDYALFLNENDLKNYPVCVESQWVDKNNKEKKKYLIR